MFNFLALLALQLVFEILDYVWNSLASLRKEKSRWKNCPRDLDFWHSVHGVISSLSLLLIVIMFTRIRLNNLHQKSLLGASALIQFISFYWLIVGITWINKIVSKDKDCVRFMQLPESLTEVYLTYLSGVALWILETYLILKCSMYLKTESNEFHSASEVINKLDEVELEDDQICAICLDGLPSGITLGSCKHSFHRECLLRWIETSQTCPYCREVIMQDHKLVI